ncbi:hypothetical protein [uncultured Clostridium sp.]|uniref:hypothetical protein n=1 Tax=uncultured Clostridium sp. TaxID=59620 RepID=UPI0032169F1B
MLNDTEEYFYIRNAQSDIIGIINSIGKQVVSYTYDTWGKLISVDKYGYSWDGGGKRVVVDAAALAVAVVTGAYLFIVVIVAVICLITKG